MCIDNNDSLPILSFDETLTISYSTYTHTSAHTHKHTYIGTQRIHYKIVYLTYNVLQISQLSYIRQLLTIQPPGSTRSKCISVFSLFLSEVLQPLLIVYAALALWNGLPIDLRQFAHPPNSPLTLTPPPLTLHSPPLHSTHD